MSSGSWLLLPAVLLRVVLRVLLRDGMDRRAYAWVRAAAAEVPAHGRVNLGIGRRWCFLQEGRGLHDLPALAVAALRYVVGSPGELYGMRTFRTQALDRRDALPLCSGDRGAAG